MKCFLKFLASPLLLPDCSFSTPLSTGNDTLGNLKKQYYELELHTGRGASDFSHLRMDITHVKDPLEMYIEKNWNNPTINQT